MKTIAFSLGLCLSIQFIYAQTNQIGVNGSVGIGITNPIGKLQVVNTEEDSNGTTFILGNANGPNLRMGYNIDYNWIQSHGGRPLHINDLGNDLILNSTAWNVGIGTITPKEKLSVNGNIRAREIRVETTEWPDYVFKEVYQPMSLSDLEVYIKKTIICLTFHLRSRLKLMVSNWVI
ncbi:hypothetical protein [Pedobacter sp. NJ-S-72]